MPSFFAWDQEILYGVLNFMRAVGDKGGEKEQEYIHRVSIFKMSVYMHTHMKLPSTMN